MQLLKALGQDIIKLAILLDANGSARVHGS